MAGTSRSKGWSFLFQPLHIVKRIHAAIPPDPLVKASLVVMILKMRQDGLRLSATVSP